MSHELEQRIEQALISSAEEDDQITALAAQLRVRREQIGSFPLLAEELAQTMGDGADTHVHADGYGFEFSAHRRFRTVRSGFLSDTQEDLGMDLFVRQYYNNDAGSWIRRGWVRDSPWALNVFRRHYRTLLDRVGVVTGDQPASAM